MEVRGITLWWAKCLTCDVQLVVDADHAGKMKIQRFLDQHDTTNHAVECFVGDEPCPFCG